DATGKITAVGAGTAVITVKSSVKETVSATFDVEVIDVSLIEYDTEFVLLDSSITDDRFEKITVDEVEYYVGLNAFSSAEAAFNALEENSTLIVKAGTYEEAVTIKVNGV